MQDHTTEQELKDRLSLIESMIAKGRRNTESWGWTFVLWGAVYYLAIAWSAWGHSVWAWPVTMLIAVIVTIVGASLKAGIIRRPPWAGRSVLSGLPWEFRCFCSF